MSRNVFTAGIEPGGLTTDYEIRMLICHLLFEAGAPVTMGMLNDALLKDGLVNYFQLANETSALISSFHITDCEKNDKGEALLNLTEKGIKTAQTFYKNIPLNVREKALSNLREAMTIEKSINENKCSISQSQDGVRLNLEIADYGSDLLKMDFYLPTTEIAKKCRENFLKDPTLLYRAVIKALSGEDIGSSAQ